MGIHHAKKIIEALRLSLTNPSAICAVHVIV
jgi:hypothetical protein